MRAGRIVEKIVVFLLLPLVVAVKRAPAGERRNVRFQLCSEFLGAIPFQAGMLARRIFYERVLRACGSNLVARYGVAFVYPDAAIGNRVLLGRYVNVGLVDIGDDVMVSHGVSLLSGRHHHSTGRVAVETDDPLGRPTRIRIGARTWIGAGAIVMADVGDDAVVGAGSVVVRPVPESTIVAGNPAKIIRRRDAEATKSLDPVPGASADRAGFGDH